MYFNFPMLCNVNGSIMNRLMFRTLSWMNVDRWRNIFVFFFTSQSKVTTSSREIFLWRSCKAFNKFNFSVCFSIVFNYSFECFSIQCFFFTPDQVGVMQGVDVSGMQSVNIKGLMTIEDLKVWELFWIENSQN